MFLVQWIHCNATLLWWLAAASMAAFIATLVIAPLLLVRIPPDYFLETGRPRRLLEGRHPLVRAAWLIGMNLLGAVFVVAGILMLVLPGQGLLTILAGILLVSFPGKRRFERWIVSHAVVLRLINWLRRREGRPPLLVDPCP